MAADLHRGKQLHKLEQDGKLSRRSPKFSKFGLKFPNSVDVGDDANSIAPCS